MVTDGTCTYGELFMMYVIVESLRGTPKTNVNCMLAILQLKNFNFLILLYIVLSWQGIFTLKYSFKTKTSFKLKLIHILFM